MHTSCGKNPGKCRKNFNTFHKSTESQAKSDIIVKSLNSRQKKKLNTPSKQLEEIGKRKQTGCQKIINALC